jgi:hypothetical protein
MQFAGSKMNRMLAFSISTAATLTALIGTAQASTVFRDDFEYAVGRSDPNAPTIFMSRGWSHVKSQQTASGARGYLYTVNSIPGFSGRFPGASSSRVLAMEALPRTLAGQTDFYLQLGWGNSATYDDKIPGNVWFQFWVYPQDYGDQRSTFGTRTKFFYVCNSDYPCHSHLWMLSSTANTYDPSNLFPAGNPSQGEFFLNLAEASGASTIRNSRNSESPQIVGPTDLSEGLKPNRWTLVKMHFNTTSTSGNSWEVWLRPVGGGWTKVSEWIGGRTPGFTWDIPSESVGGHRVLRMPSTVGGADSQWYDYWMYIDDFVIATAEEDLPDYPDVPAPSPPTGVLVE